MPLYRVLTRPNLLSAQQRVAFSQDVVDVHCGVTGAPRSFVHVIYAEDDEGKLQVPIQAMVLGTIRNGRNEAAKREIREGLNKALANRAGVDITNVATLTVDIEASYTMEGGKLLPEPGSPEEEAWKALSSGTP